MKKTLTVFVVALTLVFGFMFVRNNGGYTTYKVEEKEIVNSVYGSGYIDSKNSVIVRSQVSGYIQKIFVKENQNISKGQTLAVISNPTLQDNLREVQSQIELTTERLKEDSPYMKELRALIDIKKTNLENLKNIYERRKQLFEKGLISKEAFEEVEKNLTIAQKDYEKQLKSYEDIKHSLKSQLNSLIAKRDSISSEIEKYSVKSPVDGMVMRKFVNEGDYINSMTASNQLFMVGNPQELETVINIDEEYIPLLKPGQKVLVVLDAYQDEVFEGSITLVESAVDRNTRTVKVKADINYTKPVTVGMVVEANIILSKHRGIFIPQEAVKDGYVEVVENQKIRKVRVSTGKKTQDGYIQILDGLKVGQEIVIR